MWGIVALLIAFTVFYFMFQRLQTPKTDVFEGPFALKTTPQVADNTKTQQLLNSANTGTIQAFVYPLQPQKTGTMVVCNPRGGDRTGDPDCATGQFDMCKCEGSDCSKCIHSGYVNILNISNVLRLELLAAPDAGRPNAASVQLVVRTLGMSTQGMENCPYPNTTLDLSREPPANIGNVKFCCDQALQGGQCPDTGPQNFATKLCYVGDLTSITSNYHQNFYKSIPRCSVPYSPRVQTTFEETIPLPDIPFQKWTYVSIAREGRRFDVYYNGKIVASKRTQNIVDLRSGFGPITAGSPQLTGKIAFVETTSKKLNQSDVESSFKAKSDTLGQPIVSGNLGSIFDYLPDCKDGGCITGPKVRPTSPLLDWNTQYA